MCRYAGAFGLCRITERYNGRPLPPVEIVDMKRELREGNASIIERAAAGPRAKISAFGQQSILYLNRRGTSRMLALCRMRQRPDVSGLQPAADVSTMRERAAHVPHLRPQRAYACTLPRLRRALRQIGCGTQRVEEQLQNFAARRRRAAHGCRHRLGSQYP